MSLRRLDLKSGLILGAAMLGIIAVPFALIKNHVDGEHLKQRSKVTICSVIGLQGLKRKAAIIEYTVKNQRHEMVLNFPYLYHVELGEKYKIRYDTADVENIQVIWERKID